MEKYEKLFKGLEMCTGPECSTDCPYYGETRGGKTCRAWLLNDAAAALVAQKGRADELQSDYTFVIKNREELAAHNNALKEECKRLHERCQVQQSEIDALVLRLGKAEGQKPAPVAKGTVEGVARLLADANYWRGQADALKWLVSFYFSDNAAEDDTEPEPEATDNPKQTDKMLGI